MIRELVVTDLEQVNHFLLELNTLSIKEEDLKKNIHEYLVYEIDDKIVGFIGYSIYCDRAEVDYIYVIKEYRNQKIGTKLLEYVINICNGKCYNITLEVGKHNESAISLYEKMGFKRVRIINNYYKNEDGILMLKELD